MDRQKYIKDNLKLCIEEGPTSVFDEEFCEMHDLPAGSVFASTHSSIQIDQIEMDHLVFTL